MAKQTWIWGLIVGMILVQLQGVYAWDWDNRGTFYNNTEGYGTMEIKDHFGRGNSLANVTLLENTFVCPENKCRAKGKIELYERDRLIKELGTFNKRKTREEGVQNLRIQVRRQNTPWVNYHNQELPPGTYLWRLQAEIEPGQEVDWIGNFLGVTIEEWALWTSEYAIRINASSVNETLLEINNVVVTDEGGGTFKLNTTEVDYEVARAQIMKTLFWGTDGTDPRIYNITGLTRIDSIDIRDINKTAFYAYLFIGSGTGTRVATINGASATNNNVSIWTYVATSWFSGGPEYMRVEFPSGSPINSADGTTVDETGTDTTADEEDNPANIEFQYNIVGGANDGWGYFYVLTEGNLSWSSSVTTYRNYFDDGDMPRITYPTSSAPNISVNLGGKVVEYRYGPISGVNITSDIYPTEYLTCWYASSVDSYATNNTFDCENFAPELDNGNYYVNIYAQDVYGSEGSNLSNALNISMNSNISLLFNGGSITPTCTVTHGSVDASLYWIGETSFRATTLECSLEEYATEEWTIYPNSSQINFTMTSPTINITFSEATNATLTWLGGSAEYTNVTNITGPYNITGQGEVSLSFNGDTQTYSFDNDYQTNIQAELLLEDVDFDQPVKVLSTSSEEIAGALVTFYKTGKITYAGFTDINGITHAIVNDGTTYEIHSDKVGYEDYASVENIPASNTETIIINMISTDSTAGGYYFAPSCLSVVGQDQNCSWYAKAYTEKNITFNYTWNGNNYSVTSETSEANLTLLINSTTVPVNVVISINPTYNQTVTWANLSNRSVQLIFDSDSIKNESNQVIVLFYTIALLLGITIAVLVNRIEKLKGKGVWGLIVWLGIIAINGFPLLWFIIIPGVIYGIFKTFWGEEE